MTTPKFIQIMCGTHDGGLYLYALDASGQVWRFDFAHSEWDPISGKRCHD